MASPDVAKDGSAGVKKRSPARVRDNQRRSRERHKAFVEDLQRRVQEYEKQGAQATLDMQQAARRVALENSRLRHLLQRRGVPDDEVERFVRTGVDEGTGVRRLGGTTPKAEKESDEGFVSRSPTVAAMSEKGDSTLQTETPDKLAVLADASTQDSCCNGKTKCSFPTEDPVHETIPPREPELVAPLEPSYNLDSSTTMSCTEAAAIVAEMQGHGDSALAKAALGCGARSECTVKNTALFDVLDGGNDGV